MAEKDTADRAASKTHDELEAVTEELENIKFIVKGEVEQAAWEVKLAKRKENRRWPARP